jgi:hypothetical protein
MERPYRATRLNRAHIELIWSGLLWCYVVSLGVATMKHLPFLILLVACTANQAHAEQQVPSPLPPEVRQRQAAADAPVYHRVKAPPRPDYSVMPITCDEPIKPRDFPPLPDRLDFAGLGDKEKVLPKSFLRRTESGALQTWSINQGDFGSSRQLFVPGRGLKNVPL